MTLIAGKYQLIRKLATGGMAEVFLAKAAGPGGFEKILVLKFILPHLAQEPSFVEMFHSEATLAAQLSHPHIVQIFDFGEANGTYFLAMEYVDGPSLRALIKATSAQGLTLPATLCARLICQACEGLAFAHDVADPQTGLPLGIIHRDISPDNLLLTRQGALKVVDFGIAKAAGQQHKTESGVIKGKLSYMPPEQLRASTLDRRVDVYALGMVLYELLTFHKPYHAQSDAGLMQTILFEPPMPATHYRPELPEFLLAILARATAKEREERYPDCQAFQSDLEEFILSVGRPVTAQQVALFIQQVVPKPSVLVPTPPEGSLVAPRDASQPRAASDTLPDALVSQTREALTEAATTHLDAVPTEGSASSSTTHLDPVPAREPVPPSTVATRSMRPRPKAPVSRVSKGLALVGAVLFPVMIALVLWRVMTVEKRLDTLSASPASTTALQPVARAPLPPDVKADVKEPVPHEGVGGSGDVQPPASTLPPSPVTPPGSVATVPTEPPEEQAPTPHAVPSVTHASPRRTRAPAMGKLTVRAYPYADVFVDAEYKGTTPLAKGLALPVGRHSVRFENSDYKPDIQWVEVKEGESVQVVAHFGQSGP